MSTQRKTVVQKVVEAPERAPFFAYVVTAVLFSLWTWRMVAHVRSGAEEATAHIAVDGALLLGSFIAYPGFMKYFARNAGFALDLYKRFKATKKEGEP